ncbi:MAG: hypothetical protein H7Z43_01430 [Clostridia bacterium]|nr:hypothetical protein [Deltaproteobacteria bacterium]
MDGLSKRAGLPQLKVAWTCVHGDAMAMNALAWTNDAYLSCGLAQHELPELFACGQSVAAQIRRRIITNMATLRCAFADIPAVSIPAVVAGWTAVVRVPRVMEEDAWVIACAHEGARVQPGYFYDFEVGAHLVVSLIGPAEDFEQGIGRVARVVRANV